MGTVKKIITEERAAAFFHFSVIRDVEGRWPQIKSTFRQLIALAATGAGLRDESFSFADDQDALFDLILAVVASELGALTSLFPADQAARLLELCLGSYSPEHSEYARLEIEEYRNFFQKALDEDENPFYAIPVRPLHRWLGGRMADFVVKLQGNDTGYIDPVLVEAFTHEVFFGLIGFGRWKGIQDEYEVVSKPS